MTVNAGNLRVLGIETSCDETAAAVVGMGADGRPEIMANVIYSQIGEHSAYGGVVPEIAARAHTEMLDGVIAEALEKSDTALDSIDAIAATGGPGLIGGLIAGLMTAKAIAVSSGKPLYAINHLEGHALSARLIAQVGFPYLLLLVSGGHTQIVLVRGVGDYERWGTTLDDALGEAFDKTAKLLGLGYPGGPEVEKAAASGRPDHIKLPRPLHGEPGCDFSFSGLKTAVRQRAEERSPMSERDVADLCRSFQDTVAATLADRVSNAATRFRESSASRNGGALVIAGGVAANRAIRNALSQVADDLAIELIVPPPELCSDNAAMIAWAAMERMIAEIEPGDALSAPPRARWPLDEVSHPVLGFGKRGAKA